MPLSSGNANQKPGNDATNTSRANCHAGRFDPNSLLSCFDLCEMHTRVMVEALVATREVTILSYQDRGNSYSAVEDSTPAVTNSSFGFRLQPGVYQERLPVVIRLLLYTCFP